MRRCGGLGVQSTGLACRGCGTGPGGWTGGLICVVSRCLWLGCWVQQRTGCSKVAHALTCASAPSRALACAVSQKIGVKPQDMSVVSIMPCVRKQGEADRMMFHTPEGAAR